MLKTCHYCENTTFHQSYDNLIQCDVCYTYWQPLRKLDKLFRVLEY